MVDTKIREQAGLVLEALRRHIEDSARRVGNRFPLFADPETGAWTASRRGSWTAGFWTGLLWINAYTGGDAASAATAAAWTGRLAERTTEDTATRGMIFGYGAAVGHRLCGDPTARTVASAGAQALAAAFDERRGVIPDGAALAPVRWSPGTIETTIDPVAGVVLLLAWAADTTGDGRLRRIAERHAGRLSELCLRPDGAVVPAWQWSGLAVEPVPVRWGPGAWSRGQAWGMLALAEAAWRLSPSFITPACRAADYWLARVGNRCARWRLDDPTGPWDSSASAIAALALLKLATLVPGLDAGYGEAAAATLADLVEFHLAAARHAEEPGSPATALIDGCYDLRTGTAVRHELVWGTYFFSAALSVLCGAVAPDAV